MDNLLFIGLGLMVAVVVAIGGYGAVLMLNPTRTAADRLREMQGDDPTADGDVSLLISTGHHGEDEEQASAIASILGQGSAEERNLMRRKLFQAGYKHTRALEIFNFTRIAMAIGLPIVALPATATWSPLWMIGSTAALIMLGFFGPQLMVDNAVNKRREAILKSFPDTLDLLVSSVEAGLGLDAAFRRVSSEMESSAPILCYEFQMVNHEISAGVPRIQALRRLEARTGLDEVRSLVNMLAQAERFGTSIASSLRVHATVTRQKRMSRAEAEAAKVSPKLTVIMILFLLPTLFMMLTGPAAIRVYQLMAG